MKYTNEIKVGVVIVVAAAVFYVGTQFLREIPVFSRNARYSTVVGNAAGLVSGNSVLISGVKVGSVTGVDLVEGGAQIHFSLKNNLRVTHGTTVAITGFGALGDLRLEVVLGPATAALHESGDKLPNANNKIVDEVAASLPATVGLVDTLLINTDHALVAARELMTTPASELVLTLQSFRSTAEAMENLLLSQHERVESVLTRFESVARTADGVLRDSLTVAVEAVRGTMNELSESLEAVTRAANAAETVLHLTAEGEGTIGRLMQDDSLYVELVDAIFGMNSLLKDFQEDPGKYLREMRLIDIF